jgi:hypothetical protein
MGLPPKRTNLLEFALLAGSPNIINESACIIILIVLVLWRHYIGGYLENHQ